MLVKIRLADGGFLYRNVMHKDLRKMAKSIHAYFPKSSYPVLEAILFNALQKELNVLVLDPPTTKQEKLEYCKYGHLRTDNITKDRHCKTCQELARRKYRKRARLSQQAEETDLKSVKSGFESQDGHTNEK